MMPQNEITIFAEVIKGQEQSLRDCLEKIDADVNNNSLLPFSRMSENLHFARFIFLPAPDSVISSKLVFLANVDCSQSSFLEEMVKTCGTGIDQVFNHCEGYPERSSRDNQAREVFLKQNMIPASAYYVNTIGRSVKQILSEAKLRDEIQYFLDQSNNHASKAATQIRQDIIDHISKHEFLPDLLKKREAPPQSWKIKEQARFITILAMLIVLGIILFPFVLVWIVIVQILENNDKRSQQRPDIQRLTALRANEDYLAHNQFSAVGFIKPGIIRLITLQVVLFIANFTLRHIYNKGDLAAVPPLGLDGVDTIHFARWVMIDNNKRLFFASNYDGSLESYMGDFVDKVAWGLNLVFSNGIDYPKTRWLVFEGARDEQAFKNFISNRQLFTQVWYAPYGHLTAVNIANNEAIRDGLHGEMNEVEAQRWLQRF